MAWQRMPSRPFKWFRKAAEQGDSRAQLYLGLCYSNGTGVEKDYAEAVNWVRKAAEQGNASPNAHLGITTLAEKS